MYTYNGGAEATQRRKQMRTRSKAHTQKVLGSLTRLSLTRGVRSLARIREHLQLFTWSKGDNSCAIMHAALIRGNGTTSLNFKDATLSKNSPPMLAHDVAAPSGIGTSACLNSEISKTCARVKALAMFMMLLPQGFQNDSFSITSDKAASHAASSRKPWL